jgi:hypothetical protein
MIIIIIIINSANVECDSRSDTTNNRGNCKHLKITQTVPQHLSNMPGRHEIKEVQKTAILGTAHILREVLM